MDMRFSYSIIQLSPTGPRGEYVNIGLVIFLSDRLDVRVMQNPVKIHAVDPNYDLSELADLPTALSFWDESSAEPSTRYELLARQGATALTPPGQFVLASAKDYESAVQRLMTDLVVPPPRQRTATSTFRLSVELRQLFKRLKVLGKSREDISHHKVVEHYPIDPETNLYAEFALRNGSFHCFETLDYRIRAAEGMPKFYETGAKALLLDEAQRKLGEDTKGYVIYASYPEDRSKIKPYLKLLEPRAERLYDLQSTRDQMSLANFVKSVAGDSRALSEGIPV